MLMNYRLPQLHTKF